MGRLARVVATDVPHQWTQHGNGRRFVLDGDADGSVYINLLRENLALYKVSLIGYCLMSNHIHLIAVRKKSHQDALQAIAEPSAYILHEVRKPRNISEINFFTSSCPRNSHETPRNSVHETGT
jgi:REP element-mobilizing transposase RayT